MNMIKLGKRIKELRLRGGRTQEALAGALGVTAQAVSRWEKGICYPDMEAIPSIANYFNVSIDELFGYDGERSKKADALAERINAMIRENDGRDVSMDACVALAREALIEFPGSEKLTLALASALFTAGYVRHGEHHVEDEEGYSVYDTKRHGEYAEWKEAIKLYEKLLPTLTGGDARQKAVVALSQLYKNTGEREKALLLAQSAPDIEASRPILRINAFDGKDETAASGEALIAFLMKAGELIESIVRTDIHMPSDAAAEAVGGTVGMFDLVFTDRFYGRCGAFIACLHMLRSYYLWLANDRDGAFTELNAALACAEGFDAFGKTGPEFFSSPLLHRVRTRAAETPESAFASELPDLWPWWSVERLDEVKAEMQADPRWDEWIKRAKA